MKKRYLLALGLSFLAVGSLASCGKSNNTETGTIVPAEDNTLTGTGAEGESSSSSTSTTLYTPEYHKTNAQVTTSTAVSSSTSIEDTVDLVYDSVVSITASAVSSGCTGSGVLFAQDTDLGLSYIITCFHVIEDMNKFEVTTSNGTTYTAKLVGGYSDYDLAVLSIETTGLTYASIYENSDNLKLGSSVVCIGNPLGTLPGSVSAGVVSYVNRKVQADTYSYMTLIQTDVAINSGNSGGGLFNTAGALIGVVNGKYSSSGVEGLGFAIPSKDVISTINSILSTANYDSANKCWSAGYVVGDYELGFTVSVGYYSSGFGFNQSRSYVQYVSDLSTNTTATGASSLKKDDIVTGIYIDYKDDSKTDGDIAVNTSTDVMKSLYALDLEVGDEFTFTVTRSNTSTTVKFEVTQYIYSI